MHNAVGEILTNGRRDFVFMQALIRSNAQANIQVLFSFLPGASPGCDWKNAKARAFKTKKKE